MPYTTVPTITTGQVLTAAYLNLLSANQEFLHGLANRANPPFNSYRKTGDLTVADMKWFGRHRARYFHYKVTSDTPTHVRIFYNNTLVAGDESSPPNTFSGVFDLETYQDLPNYRSTWATATLYEDSGENNTGDGDVVSNATVFYKCFSTHTSGASTEPGVGGSWATVWEVIAEPTIGDVFHAHVDVDEGAETTVEYLIETDSPSL